MLDKINCSSQVITPKLENRRYVEGDGGTKDFSVECRLDTTIHILIGFPRLVGRTEQGYINCTYLSNL